jgi:hypothetical protein
MPPPNLGDLLPYEDREKLAINHLIIGSVFKFHCLVAKKEKRLILVGFSYDKERLAFVHINTEINPNVFRFPALKAEHLPIELNEVNAFLTHDSFINCSDLIVRNKIEITSLLISAPAAHLGNLIEEDCKKVKQMVSKSKVIRPDRKKEFGCFY